MSKKTEKSGILNMNYEDQLSRLTEFLCQFEDKSMLDTDRVHGQSKYLIELQRVANNETKVIEILMEDLEHYFGSSNEDHLVDLIKKNVSRYNSLFMEAVDTILP